MKIRFIDVIVQIINLTMFNGYIAERRLEKARRIKQVQKKQAKVRQRYHTEIQPTLLEHYQKRLRSFIHKMTEHPLIINPQNLLPPLKTNEHFTFRDATDWNNISHNQTKYIQSEHQTLQNKRQHSVQIHSNCKDKVSVFRHQFRSREREKQLQPPMRFRTIQKHIEPKRKLQPKSNQDSNKKTIEKKQAPKTQYIPGQLMESNISATNSSNKHEQDEIEFNWNKQKQDNIQLEAQIYEKQREPDQKKLHFKKIAVLALNQPDLYQKQELKEILRKCGYSKIKRTNFTEASQTDNFSTLVQKIGNK